ncbi:MAG: transcriptional regulator [bacterium]|nr:transcriptional regulator [bacterium]
MNCQIRDFKERLIELLSNTRGLSSQGEKAAGRIAKLLEAKSSTDMGVIQANPLSDVLKCAFGYLDKRPGEACALANAVMEISDWLPWYKRSTPISSAFEKGHANAEIIGPRGLEIREDFTIGVTIMRPFLTYPDHHHPSEEVYIALSEGFWRQETGPWKSPGPGGYVYNPPDILHSMQAAETPLFAVWCLKPR